jgi:hypothetical protein
MDTFSWGLVIAPGAALLGVGLGKFLDTWSERGRWARSERAACYAAFLADAETLLLEYALDTPDYSPRRAQRALVALTRSGASVDIFGDKRTAETSRDLWNYVVFEVPDPTEMEHIDEAGWLAVDEAIRELINRFKAAARESLHVGPGAPPGTHVEAQVPETGATHRA